MNSISATDAAPVVDNLYALIYAVILLAVGGGLIALLNAYKQWRDYRTTGRKDRITELEDWANDMILSRDFYSKQSQWRGELNGRLIYVINTQIGPKAVAKVMEQMPPEPQLQLSRKDVDDG